MGAAPTTPFPRPAGRLPQQSFGRDGAAILQESTGGCARLCRLGSEKAGATHATVGGQEQHRRGSSPGQEGMERSEELQQKVGIASTKTALLSGLEER